MTEIKLLKIKFKKIGQDSRLDYYYCHHAQCQLHTLQKLLASNQIRMVNIIPIFIFYIFNSDILKSFSS